jgi:hypothetical protein
MSALVRTYECIDCGERVGPVGYRSRSFPRCAVCALIASLPPERAREVRRRFFTPQQMAQWVRVGSYVDESCAERACDHCGRLYRGPAVYCRQLCALEDS